MEKVERTKQCKNCDKDFQITSQDLEFYQKIKVPEPTFCPSCRQQRRAAFGNQLFLYKRKCDLTKKEIISNFNSDSPYKVYDQYVWFSDDWDPLEYGRDYDFNRTFFEQFQELSLQVPRPSLLRNFHYDENSDFTNHAGKNKNCYMIFDSDENWDCYYSYGINKSKSCLQCCRLRKCELCYECIDSYDCYNCCFIQDCLNCFDSLFLKNCIGCKNCIACSNLKNKQYYINNQKSSKEEYEKYRGEMRSRRNLEAAAAHFEKFRLKFPQKFFHGVRNENVIGDYLGNCKNAFFCFDSADLWDCKYVFQGFNPLKDSMDIQECGDAERLYECTFSGYNAFNVKFTALTLGEFSDLQYCIHTPYSTNLFGCIGLRRKHYCILNKQYSKEEYEELLPRIIQHMTKNNEYGEFFPIHITSFPYNETLAYQYFPMTKEEALKKGLKWQDKIKKEFIPQQAAAPDNIDTAADSILTETFACTECGRNYRINKQELNLLKRMHMPISPKCFYCRHEARMGKRNQRTMYKRNCQKCKGEIQTTYSPDHPEIVYCEKCYLETIE